jgi:hypothetical protein
VEQAHGGLFPLKVGDRELVVAQLRPSFEAYTEEVVPEYYSEGVFDDEIFGADATPIGTFGVANCVGVYFQVNEKGKF